MPLPRKGKKESRSKFVSRCVSNLSKKGEGKDIKQRVAICNSQFERAKGSEIIQEFKEEEQVNKLVAEAKDGKRVSLHTGRNKTH